MASVKVVGIFTNAHNASNIAGFLSVCLSRSALGGGTGCSRIGGHTSGGFVCLTSSSIGLTSSTMLSPPSFSAFSW